MEKECLASRPQLHYQLSLLLVHIYRDLSRCNNSLSYVFVARLEDFELPEPHVEGRADQGPVWLPHYDDVDAPAKRGLLRQKRVSWLQH